MNFSARSAATELMDTEIVDAEDFGRCLSDLATVNRLTLAARPTLAWLRQATRDLPRGTPLAILDVASGHGDMLRAIRRWGDRRGLVLRLDGVDLNPYSAVAATAATPDGMEIRFHTADVFTYAPAEPTDFVISSLFTHHLADADIVRFLRWMEATARRGWFVNDLHRHPISYHAFRLMSAVAGWHRFVQHDGPVSIARSFRRADWQGLLAAAGVPGAVRWHVPFRFCVERVK